MKSHGTVVFLALGVSLFALGCSDSTSSGPDPQPQGLNTELLDSLFTNFAPQYNLTDEPTTVLGHAARVTVSGEEPWERSFGTVDSLGSGAVNMSSIFRIGSTTKVFTATAILQLWEAGLIDLDSSFNYYLALDPVTYPKISDFSEVTVRHLLSHRSGLPYLSSTAFFDQHEYTDSIGQLERMSFLFAEGEPEFAPGEQYAYRNSNFSVLGMVIESVTGKAYHEVLDESIFAPLGLTNTYVLDYGFSGDDPRMAHGYTSTFDGTHYHGTQAWAGGGMVSTVRDLSVFMRALVDGDLFQRQSTFDMMVSPVPGSYYGFGMFITGHFGGPSYGHGGAIFGYNTKLEYFTDVDAIVASTMSFNGYDFVVVNWQDDFCDRVIAEVRRARAEAP